MEYLFVYGTLRRGSLAPIRFELMQGIRFYAQGSVQGRLYEVAGYPGLILSQRAAEQVYGDIYHVDHPGSLFPRLDDYEECSDRFVHPQEYHRKQLAVSLPSGDSLVAWGYVYNYPITRLQHIPGGDYIAYMKGAGGYDGGDDRD